MNNYPNGTTGLSYSGTVQPDFLGGGGGLLGFGYQMQYKRFIFHVGPEFRMFSSTDKLAFSDPIKYDLKYNGAVAQTKNFQLLNFRETQAVGQVMLPIMAGASFDRFYFLAGVKPGFTLVRAYTQRYDLTTTVDDPRAIAPIGQGQDITQHDLLTEAPQKAKGKNPFGLDIVASAEFGVNLNYFLNSKWNKDNMAQRFPYHFRVAAFVDYGFWNLNVSNGLPIAIPVASSTATFHKPEDISLTTNSLHQSDLALSAINSLLVGVKGTFLLQLNKPKKKREPNPMMIAQVSDQLTGSPLSGVKVNIYNEKTKKTSKKTTNGKGLINQRYAPGKYQMSIPAKTTPSAYLPNLDTLHILHMEDGVDTLEMQLMPKPVVTCYVRGSKSQRYLASEIVLTDAEGNEVTRLSTDSLVGKTLAINTLEWGKTYTVAIHSEGHNDTIDVLHVDGKQAQLEYNFFLSPIIPPKVWILENMHFATAKDIILPESEEALQTLYDYLSENPDKHILITGHTDSVGKDKDNQNLSERRAANVRKAMIERGIDGSRIQTNGKGESEPIDTNETEEGRARNRRVEITVLD